MVVIGLGIAVLIVRAKYKNQQTAGKRNALMVLTVLQAVFSGFVLFSLIGSLVSALTLSAGDIDSIIQDSFNTANGIDEFDEEFIEIFGNMFGSISEFVIVFMWIFIAIDGLTLAFGVITLVVGYKALSNKQWTANAAVNVKGAVPVTATATATAYGNAIQTKTCTVCGAAVPVNANVCSRCGNNTFTDVAQNFGAQPVNNAPTMEWFCPTCGKASPATTKFCPTCGTNNPNAL